MISLACLRVYNAVITKKCVDNTANLSWSQFRQKEGTPKFMRRGVVGDWKNFLSAEQSAEMDMICAERLNGTGLEFGYE